MNPNLLSNRNVKWVVIALVLAAIACNMPFAGRGAKGTPGPATRLPPVDVENLPPTTPRLVAQRPARGEELPLDGSIDLYFDQSMNRASVERALQVAPALNFEVMWIDDATLRLTPAPGQLQRAERYTVTVGDQAASSDGLKLVEPVEVEVQTVGFLEVGEVVPAADAQAVETDSVITIFFNRPVVPLTLASDPTAQPHPLTFSPDVPGQGEWVNTSIYMWTPDQALAGGQTYTVTVQPGLADQTGGILEEAFTWQFTTLPPQIVSVSPTSGVMGLPLDTAVQVEFNQPMDRQSAQAAFSLIDRNTDRAVAGSFEWDERSRILTFKPSGRLPLDGDLVATVRNTARGASGQVTLNETYGWTFRTVPAPAIIRTSPSNQSQNVPVYQSIDLIFASPMDEDSVRERLTIDPPLPEKSISVYSGPDWDSFNQGYWRFTLSGFLEPSTTYTVTLAPGASDPYGNTIDEPYTFTFHTARLDPMVQLNTRGMFGIYDASRPTELFAIYRNVDHINVSLARLTFDGFANLLGDYNALDRFNPEPQQTVRSWQVQSEAGLNEAAYANLEMTDDGTALEPGYYLLTVTAPGVQGRIRHFMIVANANLTYKVSFTEVFAWLTDLQTGQPIAGAPVTFYNQNFGVLAEGVTGPDGTLEIEIPLQRELWREYYAVVDSGDVFAVAASNWSEGISPWDFNVPGIWDFQQYSLYIYTDRPLYRPGQEVFYKGVLRDKNDVTYSVSQRNTVQVTVYNDVGDQITQQSISLTDYGTFSGSILLDASTSPGYYTIEVSSGGVPLDRRGFQVAEYARPEFQVAVEPARSAVLNGDTIEVEVAATFFFGGPVDEADVTWTALSAPHFYNYTGQGNYSFTDLETWYWWYSPDQGIPGFGEVIADGAGRTDASGKFRIQLPASLEDEAASRRFTIEAVVTDINGRSVAGRTEVIVHKGRYYVGVRTDNYVFSVGDPIEAEVIAVDWDSQPVANREISAQLVEQRWNNVQEEDEFGRTQWVWQLEQIPVGDPITVTTDDRGKAPVSLTAPEGGSYKILATIADDAGNEHQASSFLWVTGPEYIVWRQANNDRIELVPDRTTYQPGEIADILIASPFAGNDVQALITVERGSVLRHEVITLPSNSYVYHLPITGEHAPNIFVSVILIKGVDATNPVPAFRMGQVKLSVAPTEQTLTIQVTPDRAVVGPREEVTYTIKTTDHNGKAVDAEVSLALVDLATLTLAQPNSGPIVDHFYGNEALGVRTAMPLIYLVDRLNQELFDKGKGGGGGGGEGFFDVRGDFKDTAYWAATVRTGADGETTVTITLPDNLTTWRMDARAVTPDTLVGQDQVDIVSSKPLLIRPVTPRFFVVGDEVKLAAVVNNNTGQDVAATISLEASGVQIQGEAVHTVTVPANGRVQVQWPVKVLANVQWADLIFGVQGGDLQDASRPPLGDPENGQQIPVYRYEVPEVVGTAGQMIEGGERLEGVALPPNYDVTQGNLTIQISPSLAAVTLDGLTWLKHYKYECTEQVVSKFLPNIYTLRALRQFNLSDEELESNLVTQTGLGLQKLYAQQHADGGWGWFVQGPSHPTVTAYVVQGLVTARDAGLQVEERVIRNGISYLKRQLTRLDQSDTQRELNTQMYILYVLGLAGEPDVSRTVQMYDIRESLQYWTRAMLAQTLWRIDPEDPRLENLKSDLVNAAILSATGAHWEEDEDDVYNWNTDTRTTAIVLDTFALLWPDNDLAPNATRWLIVARTADHWTTTQETVWALLGLTDWMVATKELNATYDWSFKFNGLEMASGKANKNTVKETERIVIDVADLLPDDVNRLSFNRGGGQGRLYYTAHLTAYLPVEEIDPLSRGVIVSRRYLDDDGKPVTQGRVGDVLTAEVTVIAPHTLNYLVVEDYYPAGAEAVDTSLETESVLGETPSFKTDDPLEWGWGWWWFSHIDLRDEKAILYADSITAGTYQFKYQIRLGLEGVFRVIPTVAFEFYFPEVYGRGEGMLFTILPEQ